MIQRLSGISRSGRNRDSVDRRMGDPFSGWVLIVCWTAFLLNGCLFNTVHLSLTPQSESTQELRETTLYSDDEAGPAYSAGGLKNVLLIPIEGEITGSMESSGGTVYPGRIQRLLHKASGDRIQAILLKVNSPGGSASASDTIYRQLRRFSAERHIPVFVHIEGLGASGGYYVSMAGRRINASPVSLVGSIGVIIRTFGVQGLMEKTGVEYRSIQSGKNKDILSPFREMSEEQKQSLHIQVMQNYEMFLKVVRAGRQNISEERLRKLADGNIYSAEQAKENGLIDSILPLEEYLGVIRTELNASGLRVFAYLPEGRKDYNMYNTMLPADASPGARLMRLTRSGVFFLWEGGL